MSAKSRRMTLMMVIVLASGVLSLAAQSRLAAATGLRCSFARQATGGWTKEGTADAQVGAATLVLRFESIDTDTGVATLRSGTVTSDVTARASDGYLHLMQVFRTGPMYITTIFDPGGSAKFKAVHSRHEYFTVPLPGATSSPEQYYGDCEAV